MTENPKDCPYDEAFFNYTMRITMSSARDIVALMRRVLPLESVLDVGCAQGVWLKAWRDSGVMDCDGIDGDHECAKGQRHGVHPNIAQITGPAGPHLQGSCALRRHQGRQGG
ncbi:MAG: hypothetical protein QF830_04855, partial [Rhodospirillales bacterium]|nr:hypothetical protein [Rhodospirillales bacterium]